MKISQLLTTSLITLELPSGGKQEVIDKMLSLIQNDPRVLDFPKVKQAVFDREKVMSTGVGKGFAIPHGKTDGVSDQIVAFGRSSVPVDYASLDGEPVVLVFLSIGQESKVSLSIKVLSRISRMMSKDSFRDALRKATTKEEILKIFTEEESNYFDL